MTGRRRNSCASGGDKATTRLAPTEPPTLWRGRALAVGGRPRLLARGGSTALFLSCFVLGALLFVAALGALLYWFGPAGDPLLGRRDKNGRLTETMHLVRSGQTASDGADAGGISHAGAAGGAERIAARPETREVRVFFTADGVTLTPQVMKVSKPLDPPARLRFAVTELLRGPSTGLLSSATPEGVELLGVYIAGDTAIVDLSSALRERRMGGPMAEMLCAYAIVNTILENVDSVARVRILVQGRPAEFLWDQVDLSAPLGANLALLRF